MRTWPHSNRRLQERLMDDDAVVVVEVFEKKTRATPHRLIAECQRGLRLYDRAAGD